MRRTILIIVGLALLTSSFFVYTLGFPERYMQLHNRLGLLATFIISDPSNGILTLTLHGPAGAPLGSSVKVGDQIFFAGTFTDKTTQVGLKDLYISLYKGNPAISGDKTLLFEVSTDSAGNFDSEPAGKYYTVSSSDRPKVGFFAFFSPSVILSNTISLDVASEPEVLVREIYVNGYLVSNGETLMPQLPLNITVKYLTGAEKISQVTLVVFNGAPGASQTFAMISPGIYRIILTWLEAGTHRLQISETRAGIDHIISDFNVEVSWSLLGIPISSLLALGLGTSGVGCLVGAAVTKKDE